MLLSATGAVVCSIEHHAPQRDETHGVTHRVCEEACGIY